MKSFKIILSFISAGIIAASSSAAAFAESGFNIATPAEQALSASAYTPATVTLKSSYSCTTDAIRINWNKVSGASGYRIYRYNGKNWVKIATIKNGGATTYRDGGLSSGTLYRYKVKAYKKVNGANYWGSASKEFLASTKAKAVKITSTSKTADAVRLNWTKQTGNGYQVYQLKGGAWTKIATVRSMNTTTYRIGGLNPSTKYQFKVRAYRTDTKGKVNAGSFGSVSVTTKSNGFSAEVNEVLKLVNVERNKAGLKSLTLDAELCRAAQVRAKEINTHFSHTRPDGTSCFTVLDEFNISWSAVGENIAKGHMSPSEVVNAWMNSEGHRKNILSSGFGKLGVGYDSSTKAWVQLFTD
ncbi:CAP domain-containing protein [Ruminococcus sp. Marseille-P6503]|uniref:CAP domain-containing protein n=1 Tax=Ruminococcus sp. Marseille-P6503 TaxID=2364796 RepID=UPI000F5350E0|nr:CAP domain-containing protein [Ruminococcus sp. Marseille-P6503]